jgi:hypothetical protein
MVLDQPNLGCSDSDLTSRTRWRPFTPTGTECRLWQKGSPKCLPPELAGGWSEDPSLDRPRFDFRFASRSTKNAARHSFRSGSGCNDEVCDALSSNAPRPLTEMGVVCQENKAIAGADVVPAAMKNMVLELHF